jgi:hypothetical protein
MDQVMEYITSGVIIGLAVVSAGAAFITWALTSALDQFFRFVENNKE